MANDDGRERRTIRLFPDARPEHTDLARYASHLNSGVKVFLEAHAKALEDVNQMIANGMVTDEFQFAIEFERALQAHKIRLRGYP